MADRLAVLKLAHNALTGLPATLTLGTLRVLVKQTLESALKPKPENDASRRTWRALVRASILHPLNPQPEPN